MALFEPQRIVKKYDNLIITRRLDRTTAGTDWHPFSPFCRGLALTGQAPFFDGQNGENVGREEREVPRRNKRRKRDYTRRLSFNPDKYTAPGLAAQRLTSQGLASQDITSQEHARSLHAVRGEIWFADLGKYDNTSVQKGCRPVVIISNDKVNAKSGTLTVIPMTSKIKKPWYPTHVEVPEDSVKTEKSRHMEESMALAEQMRTIDKTVLVNRVGKVTSEKMKEIEAAVRAQLAL